MVGTTLNHPVLAVLGRHSQIACVTEDVVDTTKKFDGLSLDSFETIGPAVECFPRVTDTILKFVVASSSNELSLDVSSQPEGAIIVLWRADRLNTDLLEVHSVVLNVSTKRVLFLILSVQLVLDKYFLLLVVLNFELNLWIELEFIDTVQSRFIIVSLSIG